MLKQISLISALFLAPFAIAQTTSRLAPATVTASMQLPPPINSAGLPTTIGTQQLSNYIEGGVGVTGGYISNLFPGNTSSTLDDATVTLRPEIAFDRTTGRMHGGITYIPSFNYYAPDTPLNNINHNATLNFQYRVNPNITIQADDTVAKSSNTLSQPLSLGSISGSLPATTPGFVVPFVPQVLNTANGQFAWQYSATSMIGFGGTSTLLNYTSPSLSTGLYNSNALSSFAFYTQQFSRKQYFGGVYQYSMIHATAVAASTTPNADLDAHNILGFYTVYVRPKLSVSLGLGTQQYNLTQAPAKAVHKWAPITVESIDWQAQRASLALSYSRVVTEGNGIVGAYSSNSATLSAQLQLSPKWLVGVTGNYAQLTPVAHSIVLSTPGGHTLSLGGSVNRQFGPNLTLTIQYQHLHQTYDGIPAIATNPGSSQETASFTYHFSRPLGM